MTTEEMKNQLTAKLKLMSADERAEFARELYGMDIVDRAVARRLLGMDEENFHERVKDGVWYASLEYRFYSLSDEFLSAKYMEMIKESGD